MFPGSGGLDIPFLTTDQMREVDRAMVEDYGILLLQMMENAGRNLAHLARRRFLADDPTGPRALVLAGSGGNGGGGLVCARRLHNWGVRVQVWVTAPPQDFGGVPQQQLAILQRMGVPVEVPGDDPSLPPADLVIDAIIGYGLRGAPTGRAAALIHAASVHQAPVLALDAPSGVDTTTGAAYTPAIRAGATLALALPKKGLQAETARPYVGELYLGDIGVPPALYRCSFPGLEVGPLFARSDILRLW
jgi:NAD(P)H-hydrate epimerase